MRNMPFILTSASLALAACSNDFELRQQDAQGEAANESVIASDDGEGKSRSRIYVPEGAEGEKGNFDVGPGATLPADVTAAYLTLPGPVTQRSSSIYVNYDAAVEAIVVGAAIITIELPPEDELALTTTSSDNYIVLYHVQKNGAFYYGALATASLTIAGNDVSFPLQGRGNYQVFTIETPLAQNTERATSAPPRTKAEQDEINSGGDADLFDRDFACPSGFVFVPGNPTPNLGGPGDPVTAFCVAKYEMRLVDGSGRTIGPYLSNGGDGGTGMHLLGPEWNGSDGGQQGYALSSRPDGLPVKISNSEIAAAMQMCSALGDGYSMMTNREWQTLARDIASNPTNHLVDAAIHVGQPALPIGISSSNGWLSFDGPTPAAAADDLTCISVAAKLEATSDSAENSYHSGGNLFELSISQACPSDQTNRRDWSVPVNRRISQLGSGDIIWDVAGNEAEWALIDGFQYGAAVDLDNLPSPDVFNDSGLSLNDLHLWFGPGVDVPTKNLGYVEVAYSATAVPALQRGGGATTTTQHRTPGLFSAQYMNSNQSAGPYIQWATVRCIYRPQSR